MITPEEVILKHANVLYDPVKRRERYLRTRQLKGRRKGVGTAIPSRTPGSGRPSSQGGRPQKGSDLARRRAQRRKEVEARVIAMTIRLKKLRVELRKLVGEAKLRSGVKPPTEPTKAPSQTRTKKADAAGPTKQQEPRRQTASEKKKAAERSKEYYEENKPKTVSISKKKAQLQRDIKVTEKKIVQARVRLRKAVADARPNQATTRPALKRRQTP